MVNASAPEIVMDSSGHTTVIWTESTYIKACSQPLNGSWGSVFTISNENASDPQMRMDAAGNATAVWVEAGAITTATMDASSSTWGAPIALSATGATSPKIAVRSNGDKVVIWERGAVIESVTQLSGEAWGTVNTHSNANAAHPHVAVGEDGTVVAVWNVMAPYNIVVSSSKTMGGSWNGVIPIVIVGAAYSFDYPQVSVDPYGNADVIWYRYQMNNGNYINVSLLSSSLPNGAGNWTALPTAFTAPGIGNMANMTNKIVHDSNGNCIALWTYTQDGSNMIVQSALKLFGQSWVINTVPLESYSYAADVCPNSLGEAVGVFMNYDGTSLSIEASECPVNGIISFSNWSTLMPISSGTNNGYPKAASNHSSGQIYAAAAWLHSDGVNTVVQAATASKTTTPPPTNLVVVPSGIDFGVFVDHYNTLTWDASSSPNIQSYAVFRNGIFLGRVGSYILQYVDHIIPPSSASDIVYGVVAVDEDASQSEIVTVVSSSKEDVFTAAKPLLVATPPIRKPTPTASAVYPINSQKAAAGSTTLLIAGVPNQKIRLFQFGLSVSTGMFKLMDSTGYLISSGQSVGASGYIELATGADLIVTCSDDCILTVHISAVVE
jgi:hypothetical protein